MARLSLALAAILILITLASLAAWRIAVVAKRQAGEDAAHDIPHGDVIHLPSGATPDLRETCHGAEVRHG